MQIKGCGKVDFGVCSAAAVLVVVVVVVWGVYRSMARGAHNGDIIAFVVGRSIITTLFLTTTVGGRRNVVVVCTVVVGSEFCWCFFVNASLGTDSLLLTASVSCFFPQATEGVFWSLFQNASWQRQLLMLS